MLEVEELRKRNPHAWTLLLTQRLGAPDVIVEAVGEEPLETDDGASRYLLSLAGCQEPIGLVGKETNAVEAMFYEFFAPALAHFTARCYFHYVGLQEGWLVLADVQNDHAPETWTPGDIEILIGNLASLHAAYWNKRDVLDQYGLPVLLERTHQPGDAKIGGRVDDQPPEQPSSQSRRIERWLSRQQRMLTEHAMRTAGPTLAPLLQQASEALETLRRFRGWPGIVDDRHMAALADLLDDPLPMLFPLRQLPSTLLHGNPSADKWRVTLFGDHYLMDWQMTTIGPGVYDLVRFIDQVGLVAGNGARGESQPAATAEETMVDSYILAMRGELGARFDARSTRLAVPAARCLLALVDWTPRLSGWLNDMAIDQETWFAMSELPEGTLREAGLAEVIGWRQSLSLIFERFLRAYRLL
jgi:hypothetical protein